MTHDNRITAIVHTYNAREHLGRVLDTLRGFDELLVVDMESTDDTCDIARQKGARRRAHAECVGDGAYGHSGSLRDRCFPPVAELRGKGRYRILAE